VILVKSSLTTFIINSSFSKDFKVKVEKTLQQVMKSKLNYILMLKGPWAIGKTLMLTYIAEELKDKFGDDIAIIYIDLRKELMPSIFYKILRELDDFGIDITFSLFMYLVYKKFVERTHYDPAYEMMPSVRYFLEELSHIFSLTSLGAKLFFAEKLKEFINEKFSDEVAFLKECFGEEYHKKIANILFEKPFEFIQYVGKALAHDIADAIKDEDADAIVIIIDSIEKIDKFTLMALANLISNSMATLFIFSGRLSLDEKAKEILNVVERATLHEVLNNFAKDNRIELLEFSPPDENTLREYLNTYGVTDKELQLEIIKTAVRHPLILELSSRALDYLSKQDFVNSLKQGFFSFVVELFKRVMLKLDENLKRAFIASVLLYSFDEDTIKKLLKRKISLTELINLGIYRRLDENRYEMYDEIRSVLCEFLKNNPVFNELKNKISKYYVSMYKKTKDPKFLLCFIHLIQLIDAEQYLGRLTEILEENFEKANFETCLKILDLFQPQDEQEKYLRELMIHRVFSYTYEVPINELESLLKSCEKLEKKTHLLQLYIGIGYMLLGRKLLKSRKVNQAILMLEKAKTELEKAKIIPKERINVTQHLLKTMCLLGHAYIMAGNIEKAREILENARKLIEGIIRKKKLQLDIGILYGKMSLLLANTLIMTGDYSDAVYFLKKAVKIAKQIQSKRKTVDIISTYGAILESLSIVLVRLGNINEAEAYIREAVKLYETLCHATDFRFAEILNNYGLALATHGEILLRKNKLDAAFARLREAATIFLLSIITSDYQLGEAISNYTRILQLISILLINSKRENEAIDLLEEAIEHVDTALETTHFLVPDLWILRGDLYRFLADILRVIGDFEEAIDSIHMSIGSYETVLKSTAPPDVRAKLGYALAHIVYGDILSEMNDIKGAREKYQEAMKIFEELSSVAEGTTREVIEQMSGKIQEFLETIS